MSITVPLYGFGGGGGASLNFKVVGNPQPASPSENTIWIDTDTPIASWIFSASEPQMPVEGMVWISTGTASTVALNAIKKNCVMVYPMSVKQYISSAWVDKTAESYQNGAWVDWIVYFYKNGNTFDDVTGGYTVSSGVTLEADCIKMYYDGQGETLFRSTNKVDLSGISTLCVKVAVDTQCQYDNNGQLRFYAAENAITSTDQDTGGGATITKDYVPGTNAEDTISLDVSGITGSKYIIVALKNPGKYTKTTFNIKEIWGE